MLEMLVPAVVMLVVGIGLGPAQVAVPRPSIWHKVLTLPSQFVPAAAQPQEGVLASNDLLQEHAVRMFNVSGPEHILISRQRWVTDAPSHMIMLDKWGTVLIADEQPDGSYSLQDKPYARLGVGRPMGFIEDAKGNLIIAEAVRGLIMLEKESRQVVQLTTYVSPDSPFDPRTLINMCNGVAMGPDGTLYFTSSQEIPIGVSKSGEYDLHRAFLSGILHGPGTGRLLAYYPETKSVHVLANRLAFPNGLVLSDDEAYIAFAETTLYRVSRYWLKGPLAGTTDVLVDGLPGAPDNLSKDNNGNIWVAMIVERDPFMLNALKWKLVRSILAMLRLTPKPKPYAGIMKVSPEGAILNYFDDHNGTTHAFTSHVIETEKRLYLTSIVDDYLSYVNKASLGL